MLLRMGKGFLKQVKSLATAEICHKAFYRGLAMDWLEVLHFAFCGQLVASLEKQQAEHDGGSHLQLFV